MILEELHYTWLKFANLTCFLRFKEKTSVSFVGLRRQHTHNLTQLVWQVLAMQV